MFIFLLFRFFRGYVKFRFDGGFIQTFINTCVLEGIALRGVAKIEEGFTAYIPASQYRLLRSPARKSGVKVRIIKKSGLPFIVHQHRGRWGIPVGAIVFLVLMWFLPQHIWEIRISGNKDISEAEIRNALDDIGIVCGMKTEDTDYDNARQRLILRLPALSWCSLNIEGSVMTVEVRERVYKQDENRTTPCNLIAKCDGYITDTRVLVGKAAVIPGDAVLKGDLLVSGVVEYASGHTEFKTAKAQILAQTEHTLDYYQPFEVTETHRTGKALERSVLSLFGIDIPLYLGSVPENCQKETEDNFIELNGHTLPLGTVTATFYETKQIAKTLDEEEAIKLAENHIAEAEKTELSGIKILSREKKVDITPEGVKITIEYTCIEDIVLQSDILILEE